MLQEQSCLLGDSTPKVPAEALLGLVRTAQDSAGAEAGAALGVEVGFNSADGD